VPGRSEEVWVVAPNELAAGHDPRRLAAVGDVSQGEALGMSDRSFEIRRLSMSEILDEGFRLFRHGFLRFLVFQLILYVPSLVLVALMLRSVGDLAMLALEGKLPSVTEMIALGGAYVGAFAVLQTVIASISTIALTRGVSDTYLSRPWTVSSILRATVKLAPQGILAGLLLGLMIFGAAAIPMVVFGGGMFALVGVSAFKGDLPSILALVTVGGFGGLLGLAAAGYIVVRYCVAYAALSIENLSATRAFGRSARLVSGRSWRALGLLVILVMLGAALGGVLSAFVPSPSFEGKDLDELRQLVPQLIRSQILSSILTQAVGVLTNTYALICWTLFYFTSRCESEGFDLTVLAERISGQRESRADAGQ
jgi:hypothetical protein